ncbi:hypothetical protein ACI7YT_12435 [Microbacterium sp. M]|uniref:hypothetical protein n=1 Tax=Microbacterium sp. M TaxID=3377125 RepID=UPI003866E8CE
MRIPSLSDQVVSGQYAAASLRDAENMMSLIAQWDSLRYSEKLAEIDRFEAGGRSRFSEVPGFGLSWCGACVSEVLLDYSEDPEGSCMVCGALANGPDRIAA